MRNNTYNASRRQFLNQSGKVGMSLGLGSNLLGSTLISACGSSTEKATIVKPLKTGFNQADLPYEYAALAPSIDAMTMEIHHTKHAAGYAKKLRQAATNEGVDQAKPLEKVLEKISKYSTSMRNNAGGHYNHELFWQIMSPNGGGKPEGELLAAIEVKFGSYNDFKSTFEKAGADRFGSGWAWLVWNNGSLEIGSTPNQDNPLMDVSDFKGVPLMGIDVWEHAYYLKYQNERGDYISNWWDVLNWSKVAERFDRIKGQV